MDTSRNTAILLLSCPDRKGLVAGVAHFIFQNNGNIIHADQHTDMEQSIFLQRVEWELRGFRIPREEIVDAFRPLAERFDMTWDLRFSDDVRKTAIPVIVSNHAELRPIGDTFGIPFQCYDVNGSTQAVAEHQILERLEKDSVDCIVLARYMRILSREFVSKYPNKIINIHHSFLPAFAGSRPYHRAYDRGVKIIGATAHYVTAELDQGPIIEQDVVRVSHRDSVEDLIVKGRDLEKMVLARAVKLHLSNRILVYGNKTVVFD